MQAILETPLPQRTIPQTSSKVRCLPRGCAVFGSSVGYRHARASEPELAECGERCRVNTRIMISFFPSDASVRGFFRRAELESVVLFRRAIGAGG
jgi:hypothetical protein